MESTCTCPPSRIAAAQNAPPPLPPHLAQDVELAALLRRRWGLVGEAHGAARVALAHGLAAAHVVELRRARARAGEGQTLIPPHTHTHARH